MSFLKKKSRYNTARRFLIFWMLFIGIGAVLGSVMMLADSSGKIMEMDDILKIRHTSLKGIRCRKGVFKEIKGDKHCLKLSI